MVYYEYAALNENHTVKMWCLICIFDNKKDKQMELFSAFRINDHNND